MFWPAVYAAAALVAAAVALAVPPAGRFSAWSRWGPLFAILASAAGARAAGVFFTKPGILGAWAEIASFPDQIGWIGLVGLSIAGLVAPTATGSVFGQAVCGGLTVGPLVTVLRVVPQTTTPREAARVAVLALVSSAVSPFGLVWLVGGPWAAVACVPTAVVLGGFASLAGARGLARPTPLGIAIGIGGLLAIGFGSEWLAPLTAVVALGVAWRARTPEFSPSIGVERAVAMAVAVAAAHMAGLAALLFETLDQQRIPMSVWAAICALCGLVADPQPFALVVHRAETLGTGDDWTFALAIGLGVAPGAAGWAAIAMGGWRTIPYIVGYAVVAALGVGITVALLP